MSRYCFFSHAVRCLKSDAEIFNKYTDASRQQNVSRHTHIQRMETFLLLLFAAVAALTAVLELSKRQSSKPETANRDFIRFRNNYVLVYALMMGGSLPLAACPSS